MDVPEPLQLIAPSDSSGENGSVTVLVNRTVPLAEAEEFLKTVQELLREFDRFTGTAGSLVFRRRCGESVEFSILQRFVSRTAHEEWLQSPDFIRWRSRVAPQKPTAGHVQRYVGMESFFVSAQAPEAPPRWKMAIILMLVVYPMSLVMSHWLAPILEKMPLLIGSLLTSVFMVLLMTYVLVPPLTKLFEPWLNPAGEPKAKAAAGGSGVK